MRRSDAVVVALAALAIVVGSYTRIAHLGRELIFQDESDTALYVSGHDRTTYFASFDGRIHPADRVASFTRRDPRTNVVTVVRTLARDDPHHAPLFYALDRLAIDALGSSLAAYRFPSLVFGLLAIGLAFVFGKELLRSRLGGAVLASLVAVSPLHVLYARQAREYALFSCAVFASSTVLLRALERRTAGAWIAYAVVVTAGLYTDPIFALVLASQVLSAVVSLARRPRALGGLALAAGTAFGVFIPWIVNAVIARDQISALMSWSETAYPLRFAAEKWAFNFAAVFFDAEFANVRLIPLAGIAAAIGLGALVIVIVRGTPRVRAFVLPLTFVTVAVLVARDQFEGSHLATIARYLTASWIGLEIAVAAVLAAGLSAGRRGALTAYAVLVLAGAYSAVVDNHAVYWWNNINQFQYELVAQRIDADAHPLVIDQDNEDTMLGFSLYLRPSDECLFFRGGTVPALPRSRSAYLVEPSEALLADFQTRLGYASKDVTPPARTAIDAFHQDLHRAAPQTAAGAPTADLLWHLVPRSRADKKRALS